jgi:uronate dehydrogenase
MVASMLKQRILLTGAAGRVGRLVRPLLQAHYALRVCDLQPLEPTAPDEEVLIGDLTDPKVARQAVEGVAGVVHLAGLVAPHVSFEDTLDPNYRALLNLLEACRQSGVPRFVFASSHHIVGMYPPGAIEAAAPVAPDGFYGLSKAFGEAACALYSRRFGLRILIIRIGNADPQVVDGRRERLWVSARDLAQLILIGVEHEEVRCEIVYGTSNCPDAFFPNEAAARFGYRPQDHASEHRAANFRPLAAMSAADGAGFVGGGFAASPLPAPDKRT